MVRTSAIRFACVLFVALAGAAAALAQSRDFAFALNGSLAGVSLSLPANLRVKKANSSSPLDVTLEVRLDDVFAKVNVIVDSLGVQRIMKNDVMLTHKGTGLSISEGKLHAKVHLHARWKGKIAGIKSSASTDGSITLHATPVIQANRIGLDVDVEEPRISNDIVRNAADFVDGRDIAQQLAQKFLDQALADPSSQLPLPDNVKALGVSLSAARFETRDGQPLLILDGSLSNAAIQWLFR